MLEEGAVESDRSRDRRAANPQARRNRVAARGAAGPLVDVDADVARLVEDAPRALDEEPVCLFAPGREYVEQIDRVAGVDRGEVDPSQHEVRLAAIHPAV